MAEAVVNATDATAQNELFKSSKPVLVDFWASWCAPCRATKPIVAQVAGEMKDELKVVAIDVDKNPQSAGQFNVMSIPALFVIDQGKVKKQLPPPHSAESLKQNIKEALENK